MDIEEIFSEAAKIDDPQARQQYLGKVCADNPNLRSRVDALLSAQGKSPNFMETAAPQEANYPRDTSWPTPNAPIDEKPGTIVGRYKLLQKIGEGGMGVVYMADQEKPVHRRVALKIIKPGMDSAQVIARFEAERQALAMMDHPNIARVLDAGCTDTGRPYFVMELVQGIPITDYCDDKQLSTEERLDLFILVCHAVQHAHQKGIIHRDIKPSNVLVMIYDSKPVPKIIDFGVAKALHQRLTEMTMFTQFGAVVGTLEYMSPEQAEMDALGTDTRSDIYSLGVLLYELLTGSTPMDGKQLRSLGYAEMLKTIRELEPPKPSTRLTQSRDDMGTISAKRHTEPKRLQRLVAGDLDWIVMKCLEKDRTRRYETANGLAMDIQRHLHDEAVTASPPGQFYKLQKLVRRNKLTFAAIGAVVGALVIGLAGSIWQANRAEREANRANEALNDLRAAAPSIAAEARALAGQEKFDEAIGKLEYATKLRPDAPEYLLSKADLLETKMRLSDAAVVYRAALKLNPNDARAKENAELCEQLASSSKSADGKLSRETLSRLNAQMLKDQRPSAEIMPVARLLGDEKKYIVNYWLDRLKDQPNGTDKPIEKRLIVREDGLLELDLSGTKIVDLAALSGMPLGGLSIDNCTQVTDLSPLRGMPLTELFLQKTGVTSLEPLHAMGSLQTLHLSRTTISDLSPLSGLRLKRLEISYCPVTSLASLKGMPLEKLDIPQTAIADLSPLAGMPLKCLDASWVPVTDFAPLANLPLEILCLQGNRLGDLGFLKGMPLKKLTLLSAKNISNFAVLSDIQSLEVLALPDFAGFTFKDIDSIENLRNHPGLKQISTFIANGLSLEKVPPKDEFWKNWDRDFGWTVRLRKAGIAFSFQRVQDGSWYLSVRDQPRMTDLTILAGAAISQLEIRNCKVSDLTPLKTMPLKQLDITGTSVTDLSPLVGMKLDILMLAQTRVKDLSPVSGMPLIQIDLRGCDQLTDLKPVESFASLVYIFLPSHITELELLHKLPNLKLISFSFNPGVPNTSAESFWKTWDGLPWARKLEAAGITFNIEQLVDGYYSVTVHDPKFTDCSVFKGSNVRSLDLEKSGVLDIKPLAELPLWHLDIRETGITDLSPLRSTALGSAMREIRLWRSKVTDFSPIAACSNLELFDASDMPVNDLSIFKDKKLKTLMLARTPVSDISIAASLPLETLYIEGTKVTDLSPLLRCPTLKYVHLPKDVQGIASLRAMKSLERISFGDTEKTDAEFWYAYKDDEQWAIALNNAKLTYTKRLLQDKTWDLKLDNQSITDISLLKGVPISRLSIMHTPITDLSPLRDASKLTYLNMVGAEVKNLDPLKGMPIKILIMAETRIKDLTPLIGMPLDRLDMNGCPFITEVSALSGMSATLQSMTLPPNAQNFEFLRKFPKLTRISYTYDQTLRGPSQSAEEFWTEYDRKHNPATTQSAK